MRVSPKFNISLVIVVSLFLIPLHLDLCLAGQAASSVQASIPDDGHAKIARLPGETPRSSVETFIKYAGEGDFKKASAFLDLRYLPPKVKKIPREELARKLKIILDRSGAVDPATLSDTHDGRLDDGLPKYLEQIGRIHTPKGTVNIMLRRVSEKGGMKIWKFSNKTVAQIPLLYKYFGYRPLETKISSYFPDIQFLGWQLWQWCAYLVLLLISYLLIWIPSWLAAVIVQKRNSTAMAERMSRFIKGPVRILAWVLSGRFIAEFLMPSAEIRDLINAGTLFILALCWAGIRAVDLLFEFWSSRLERDGRQSSTVLLKPLRTILRISLITFALLLWLDNMGYRVSALLAGLGVGGLAVALAAQGVLKNLLGTVMILADRPYRVGERIVVNGYDGEVEGIGLRSTSIRLLTGHLTSIPNDEMERSAVENIGRRPFIRRKQDIRLALDTPPEKIETAVSIVRQILENHQGMSENYPPRVYFDKIRPDAINIVMFYWYHPPEYWEFLEFSQKVNSAILQAFEKEGIKLAPPTKISLTAGLEDGSPLKVQEMQEGGPAKA